MRITVPSIIALIGLASIAKAEPGSSCCDIPSFIPEPEPLFQTKGTITLPSNADDVNLNWPIASFVLNSPFGPRQLGSAGARYDWHRGTDLKVPTGTSVVAPANAVVVYSGVHPSFADPVIQLRHNDTAPFLYTLYLHMSVTSAVAGETIAAGTEIGKSGQGTASYPHLHWEVRRGCLRQECCEHVYGYMDGIGLTTPSAPTIAAAGDSAAFGRMILLGFTFPEDEIDFQGVDVSWGASNVTADLDDLNALSPLNMGALLDDPLYFAEDHGRNFVFFPKRFNESFDSADYQFLAWDLDSATSGTAKVLDAGGRESSAALSIDPPPITVTASQENILLEPASDVSIVYTVTNNDTVPRMLEFSAISGQSLDIDLSTASANLAPGASTEVTLETTLDPSFPEDVGDVILLITTVQGTTFTPLLTTSAVETSNTAMVEAWGILGE